MKKYYAMQWIYGRAVDNNGDRLCKYYAFPSPAERDDWVAKADHIFLTNPGARESVAANDLDLRRAKKRCERDKFHKCTLCWDDAWNSPTDQAFYPHPAERD